MWIIKLVLKDKNKSWSKEDLVLDSNNIETDPVYLEKLPQDVVTEIFLKAKENIIEIVSLPWNCLTPTVSDRSEAKVIVEQTITDIKAKFSSMELNIDKKRLLGAVIEEEESNKKRSTLLKYLNDSYIAIFSGE